MHIPPNSVTLESLPQDQIRLLLQGFPGTGKTYSVVRSFPNPLVLDFDKKLGAHRGRKEIIRVDFCDSSVYGKYAPMRMNAITIWLSREGIKMTKEQTLIIDSWTALQTAYDKEAPTEFSTRTGKEDRQTWFGKKLIWNTELCDLLKSLKCNIVVNCHEQPERDEEGAKTGKVRPLVTGQFADKMASFFTDAFRQTAVSKPTDLNKVKLEDYGFKTTSEFQTFMDSFEGSTMYLWQTKADSVADCLTSNPRLSKYIKADYNELIKYAN